MPAADIFRRCWFHIRDYGLMVARALFTLLWRSRSDGGSRRIHRGENGLG
jgi:hypothetical protein